MIRVSEAGGWNFYENDDDTDHALFVNVVATLIANLEVPPQDQNFSGFMKHIDDFVSSVDDQIEERLMVVLRQERFREIAFENYTESATLRTALDTIRAELRQEDRLAIVGQSNELSPALFRWELGPPSGLPCSPSEIGGARGTDLSRATKVLLLTPAGSEPAALDITSYYLAQRQAVLDRADRGELRMRRELPVPDRHLAIRLYDRTTAPGEIAACE